MVEQDWSAIQKFCEQVNTDSSGPTHAPWLLAHKIKPPQEKEALYALTVSLAGHSAHIFNSRKNTEVTRQVLLSRH